VDKIRVLYYLEDLAQEGFIKSLVKKIASEENISENNLIHNIRSARGGSKSAKAFIEDLKNLIDVTDPTETDLIIVSKDGNCEGHSKRKKDLDDKIEDDNPFKKKIVYAIPDPHIERWYIMDQKAFKSGVGIDKAPDLPPYKCDKNYYLDKLHQVIKRAGISSLLGGAEYAERIVENMEDLYTLGKQDSGFGAFVDDLKKTFRMIRIDLTK
jgi:hypothetical protein